MFNKPAATQPLATPEVVITPETPVITSSPPEQQIPTPPKSSTKLLLIVGGLALLIGLGILLYMMNMSGAYPAPSPTPIAATPAPTTEPDGVACTMDAKICPDGSAVGRVAPSCEFEACPGETSQSVEMRVISEENWSLSLPVEWHYYQCVDSGRYRLSPDFTNDVPNSTCDFGGIDDMSVSTHDENIASLTAEAEYKQVLSQEPIVIGGKNGLLQQTQEDTLFETQETFWRAYVEHNDKTYEFFLGDLQYENIFREMLTTIELK